MYFSGKDARFRKMESTLPTQSSRSGHCTTKEYLFEGRRYWVAQSRRGFVTRAFGDEQLAINAADEVDEYFDAIEIENEVYRNNLILIKEWFENQKYSRVLERIRRSLGEPKFKTLGPYEFAIWLVWMEGARNGFILTDETDVNDPILLDGQWPTFEEATDHVTALASGRTPRF